MAMLENVDFERRALIHWALAFPLVLSFGEGQARARPRAQRLFTITRSTNKNVVCYDVRLRGDGSIDPSAPVAAYWLMAAEDGRIEGLTWLERQLAYGADAEGAVSAAGFRLRLKAFEARAISVQRAASGRYEARLNVSGKPAVLRKIHVQAEDSGFPPRVKFVDVVASALGGGAAVVERIKP